MKIITGIASFVLMVAILFAPAARADATSDENCLVTQAADAAVQRQIQMIDAAKVNPGDFFSGANSCISSNLLQSFDLSRFIPDTAGLLTGGVDSIISSVLNAAKQQVCQVLNQQLNGLISQLNSSSTCFSSNLSASLQSILGTSGSISVSSTCGAGQYNLTGSGTTNYGSIFGSASTTTTTNTAATTSTITTSTTTSGSAVSTAASTVQEIVSDFGALLFGK
ncbi:hypothetical protein V5F40_21570 [Xanthobacter sp. DSM 14520]|uniref:hypothetical protein n=1 Tax=Xanthobacter autotrophicus (strain ATCC BAA-1158 / Py2) TaxID=78245 RepID=UPI00372863E7